MEYTKEFYLQLADEYNAAVKRKKEAKQTGVDPLGEAYRKIVGEDAPFYEERDVAEYDKFVTNFITSIEGKKLSLPLPLLGCTATLRPSPLAVKKSSLRGAASLSRIVADKSDPRAFIIRSIFVDDSKLVATDAFKVVVLNNDELPEYDGEILQFDALLDKLKGKEVSEKQLIVQGVYPKYTAVIPPRVEGIRCDVEELLEQINGARSAFGNLVKGDKYIALRLCGALDYFNPDFLFDTLKALRDNGAKSVELFHERAYDPMSIYADNGGYAIIMPLQMISAMALVEIEVTGTKEYAAAKLEELRARETKDVASARKDVASDPDKANKERLACLIDYYDTWIAGLKEIVGVADPAATPRGEKPKVLAIDIETYSPIDIKKSGVYPYAGHEDFEVLLFAYAFDNEPVRVIDLASGEMLPPDVRTALTDPEITKTAYNAAFERTCISKMICEPLPAQQWECTMVKAAMAGYPFGLDAVAKAMKLPQEKMSEGRALIRYFCMPCKPTKANGERERNIYSDDLEKWAKFKEYCLQDVVVERAIRERIARFTIPQKEKELWALDQRINDSGVLVDIEFVNNAIAIDQQCKEALTEQAADITDLDNPNSTAQLKTWLSEELGLEITSLTKESIKELLKGEHSAEVMQVLKIRQEMAKTSVKKYEAMANAAGRDGRVRGLLQFYGANRTGRWAGRLVQVQNLPQNHIEDLNLARQLVKDGDSDTLSLCYNNIPDTLSQLIRTAFIAGEGKEFIVADFSAIEARVIAWLAGEKWRQEVFATHGKIYEASAAAMFNVPIESITKGSPLRQKGKVAELALGYQGGAGALIAMGALKMGLPEDELQGLVDAWRGANAAIVRLWAEVNTAALTAIKNQSCVNIQYGVSFSYQAGALHITLPSGRDLVYQSAHIGQNRFGKDSIVYGGVDQTTKQWGELETYGGKLVENIVQAIARDCLAEAMLRLDAAGYKIVMHIHDEAVIEAAKGNTLEEACDIMGQPIEWAPGLLLRADGYVTPYYKKD